MATHAQDARIIAIGCSMEPTAMGESSEGTGASSREVPYAACDVHLRKPGPDVNRASVDGDAVYGLPEQSHHDVIAGECGVDLSGGRAPAPPEPAVQ